MFIRIGRIEKLFQIMERVSIYSKDKRIMHKIYVNKEAKIQDGVRRAGVKVGETQGGLSPLTSDGC